MRYVCSFKGPHTEKNTLHAPNGQRDSVSQGVTACGLRLRGAALGSCALCADRSAR